MCSFAQLEYCWLRATVEFHQWRSCKVWKLPKHSMGVRSLLKQTTEIYLWGLGACPQKLSWVFKVRSEERPLQCSAHTAIFHIFLVLEQWLARHFFLVCSRIGHSSNLPEHKPQWFSLFMPLSFTLIQGDISMVTYPGWIRVSTYCFLLLPGYCNC